MSVTSYQLAEEHLWCCICLDVFTDPVTLPCGHNFCRSCIGGHLNSDPQRRCPMCKERVEKRQKLGVNTFISELAAQCRQAAGRETAVTPGPSHDPPVGPKHRSLKPYLLALSLLCLIVFFAFNLCFHHILSVWETRSLFASVAKSSESVCTEHGEPLEFFCKKDQVRICQSCRASRHRLHQVVPLKEQHDEKQAELWKTEARIQKMIWKRRLKIQELKRLVKLSEEAADREVRFGVWVFSSLIQTLERGQAELMEMIVEKQNAAEKQAEGLISELDQEVLELVEELSRSIDPVQNIPVRNAAPPTEGSVCPVAYGGLTRTALVRAVDQLTDNVRKAMKKLQDTQMENFLQFSVDVTLDPDTAHPALILSDDGKLVHCSDKWKKPPGDPEGPEPGFYVLGKRGFSCGRFHFDVQVKGKTAWTVGIVREPVNKKIDVKLNPEHGCWAIQLQNTGEYEALDQSPVRLSVDSKPERLRVLVDHEESLVSFYNVDAAALIYSFTSCSFTKKLFPFFSPGPSDGRRNAAPLIISTSQIKLS